MIYTYSERTVKKYTVADAVTAARVRLIHNERVNTNGMDMQTKLTLEQVNKLADTLVEDAYA